MMDALESCKKDGGLVNTEDVEELKSFMESEIIAEVIFLKRTTAPDIRLKHKVESNFVKCTSRYFYHF